MSNLSRITVALPQRSVDAMHRVRTRTDLNVTDTVARSLVALDWITSRQGDGCKLLARYPDGSEETVVFL